MSSTCAGRCSKAFAAGVPFLGICLGLQALFTSGEEAPEERGLGIYPGEVKRFQGDMRIPHMGWNQLERVRESKLLRDTGDKPYVYFAHSYYAPVVPATAATCEYSLPYTAVLGTGQRLRCAVSSREIGRPGIEDRA